MGNTCLKSYIDNTTIDLNVCGYDLVCKDDNKDKHNVDLVIKIAPSESESSEDSTTED